MFSHDIGLARLKTAIEFNENVRPIAYTTGEVEDGVSALLSTFNRQGLRPHGSELKKNFSIRLLAFSWLGPSQSRRQASENTADDQLDVRIDGEVQANLRRR